MDYLLISVVSVAISFVFTIGAMLAAFRFGVIDRPAKTDRKIHKKNIPLLGGTAIFLTFFLVLFFLQSRILAGDLEASHWIGFFVGALILVIGGALDDKFNLSPSRQIVFPVLACVSVILGGVTIERLSMPFASEMVFDDFSINLLNSSGEFFSLNLLSALIIFVWLMGMMYTTKLLDGLDGLVTGITAIGAFVIFLFTITTRYYQPDIGVAALVLGSACLGFLIFNWHPAKIFLGEGGSLFLGFALGVLSIISGGKIAIALLVMGLPILDTAWTIIRRLKDKKNPFKHADRKHLHHRLLDLGLSQKKAALIYYTVSLIFGLSALFLQSRGKMFALFGLLVFMFVFVLMVNHLDGRKTSLH